MATLRWTLLAALTFLAFSNIIGTGSKSAQPLLSSWADSYVFTQDTEAVVYSGVEQSDTGLSRLDNGLADWLVTDGPLPATRLGTDKLQVPLVGHAIVVAYHLSALNATDPPLVLDGETLARIWAGEITTWDNEAIKSLNPAVTTKLPATDILLTFAPNNTEAVSPLFKEALSAFSTNFSITLTQAGGDFAGIAALNGRAVSLSPLSVRLAYVQNTDNCLTYVSLGSLKAFAPGLAYAHMRNAANNTVAATTDTIQSAMTDFRSVIVSGNGSKLFNGGGAQSYPMSFLHYLTTRRNLTSSDCYTKEQYLVFLSWTQMNIGAANTASKGGYAPLINGFRKRMIDSLGTITCNGKKALGYAFLIGTGSPVPTYLRWAVNYNNPDFRLEYFYQTSTNAIIGLAAGDLDFGTVITAPNAAQQALQPFTITIPIVVGGLGPVYNVPEIVAEEPLVLDFQTISDIYLNRIRKWNHANITRLNPQLEHLLPDKEIIIVYEAPSSAPNLLVSSAISATIPEFQAEVGASAVLNFPVLQQEPNRTLAVTPNNIIAPMQGKTYTLGFWTNYDTLNARTVRAAAMVNVAGTVVSPEVSTFVSAMNDYAGQEDARILLLAPGNNSWPIATYNSVMVNSRTMPDCQKATALVDWLYWTQSSEEGVALSNGVGLAVAGQSAAVSRLVLRMLANVTCDGVPSFSFFNCVDDGVMCSNHGNCSSSGVCQCSDQWEGQYCQTLKSDSSSSDHLGIILGATLGAIVPVICLVLVFLVGVIVALVVRLERKRREKGDWEIDAEELEIGEQLGAGGYGTVYRAKWRGTEVAVKMMPSEQVTREMERNFKEEVRVMTALRHPNVVLFMAASTKPPKMCIVMEYMALGSLFDLLHNELIPELPYALKLKMAYHAAKGMHFLHSSGIVHRDLKSLNLLLDSKWNVKVSDFGLTKFRDELKKGGQGLGQGSIHWTAPEILNEAFDADLALADVYSFGIILWELYTREQPYLGMSPAAVAVAVIRDNVRPTVHSSDAMPADYNELMTSCWHADPAIRPTFLEVMTRLSSISGEALGGGSSLTRTSTSSSSHHISAGLNSGSLSYPSISATSRSGCSGDGSSSSGSRSGVAAVAAGGPVKPPEGEVVIVFSDITRAASLWEFNAEAMRDATLLHNELVRRLVKKHGGYEVVFLRDRNSGEGSFCLAFSDIGAALDWCGDTQRELLAVEWPEALLEHPGAAEEWGDTDDRVVFKGLRVRMGVHSGTPKMVRDPMTRRVEYIGPVVNAAARITALAHGGQVLVSESAQRKSLDSGDDAGEQVTKKFVALGRFEMPDAPKGARLYELKVGGLEARFFGGASHAADGNSSSAPSGGRSTTDEDSVDRQSDGEATLETAVGEGMMFKEDNFLTSANLCRWVIDFHEIALGQQVGMGSYGVVFKGKWKGVDVAVKRFVKQKLDERRMLEFRAEMAFLSELHHPNIVLFIGACVKQPNLCIVTEFVKQGSLKEILVANNSIKLPWRQRLALMRSAAVGVNYLHSLHPVIVHRDLKPSNLLVDENWNVKVADFGFARIKEENATMTRCGTPSWTAPEVIRGEKYSEKADVYSFGIIMWQVVTRREPFGGRNFMGVSLDVLEGKRPQVPSECDKGLKKLMKRCWHATASKRPSMDDVVAFFDSQLGDADAADHPRVAGSV